MRINGGRITGLSRAYLPGLFLGLFDADWTAAAEEMSRAELACDLDARYRASLSRHVFQAAVQAIGRKRWFNGRAVARLSDAVGRVLLLDVACAVIFHGQELAGRAAAREAQLDSAIGEFGTVASGLRGGMTELVAGLTATSGRLSALAADATREARGASAAAAGASDDARETAGSTQQLSPSITEIDTHVRRTAELAEKAASDAEEAHQGVKSLMSAAETIGSVVGLIAEIAAQTNLLALNATIEAARAGEAGLGFAVVAAEVKSLAGQTARATDDIRRQIDLIQEATRRSVDEISAIRSAVFAMEGSATTIAAAIHQQTAATERIAESAQSTSDHVAIAARAVSTVQDAIGRTVEASGTVLATSRDIADRSGDFDTALATLFRRIRAA